MYGADLLPFVLPIDDAPDFRDQRGAAAPSYDKGNKADNLREYKLYNMLRCQLRLADEVDDALDPDALLDLVILKLMYHPRFPSLFFNVIANQVEGIPTLQTKDVAAYLETNYGDGLQQPDCDYLSSILTLWGQRYPVLYPANLKKASDWLEKRQQSLPAWPTTSTVLPTGKIVKPAIGVKPTECHGEDGLIQPEFEILAKALEGVGLLDPSTKKLYAGVKSGPVAGVINYLYKKGHIKSSRKSAFRTLNESFGLTTGERNIQGHKREYSPSKVFYENTLHYFENSNKLRKTAH